MKLNDKSDLNKLRQSINDSLSKIDPSLKFGIGAITYQSDGSFASMKLKVLAVQQNGSVVTPERKSLEDMVKFGLCPVKKEDIDKTFTIRGKTFRLTGYNSRAYKSPYQVTDVATGKPYKMSEDTIKAAHFGK